MRRIVMWISSTAVVLVLLAGYHTSFVGPLVASKPDSGYSAGVLAAPETAAPSTSTAAASGAPTARSTITGDVAQTRWGPVQVEVSVTGSEITGVAVLQYPDDNSRDAEINAAALPVLVQETMTAQSGSIDMVSGATYTSVGYQQSLQSALDKAGL